LVNWTFGELENLWWNLWWTFGEPLVNWTFGELLKCRKISIQVHIHLRPFSCIRHVKDKEVYFLCCDQKARMASAQSFTLWQQEVKKITRRDHSVIACSRHIYLCVALSAHRICGELHFQRNISWEVAITFAPFCSGLQLSHILFVKDAHGTTSHPGHSTTLLRLESPGSKYAKLHTVAAIKNRDPTSRSFYFCLFATHIYGCCSSHTSRSWRIAHSTQH